MMSPKGKLTALACHPTKKVNKAEELAYLSINIGTDHTRRFGQKQDMGYKNVFWGFKG
jgi:hypothetical protein